MLESSEALFPELGPKSTFSKATTMEKNTNSNANSNKVPPRSSSTGPSPGESKPKTDGKNNGGSRRNSRKREPSFPKSDSIPGPRRTNPQKSKNFDKRPPQRGGGRQYGVAGGGRREEVAESCRAEFSPAQSAGPKKISLNHLLNFTFEPRGGQGGLGGDSHACWGRRNKWGHKHKLFNKELFLQANCQFVVTDDQDYKAHFTDPDTLVNWDCVQQVRIYSHEVPSCPICLYPPVAAHITRCGHIFCWPCMLHYLSLSDKNWSKCPICYESVSTADLRSVVAMETRQYAVGDLVTMRLMKREKGSLVAMPSSEWVKVEEPVRFGDIHLSPYSKLLLASPKQVLGLVAEEKSALQAQLIQEDDSQCCFIQSALVHLQEREQILCTQQEARQRQEKACAGNKLDLSRLTLANVSSPEEEVVTTISISKPVLQYSSAFDDEVAEMPEEDPMPAPGEAAELPEGVLECVVEEEPSEALLDGALEPHEVVVDAAPELQHSQAEPGRPQSFSDHGPYYYYYEAEDCQQMFLHPVNVRCLLREYGNLESCPQSITGTVVEIVRQTVTEEIRRVHRYLAHLPLTCECSLCELELGPLILSKETLDGFADTLEKRKRQRQRKARDEKRRERRIEMEENKKQGRYPEAHIGLENLQQFPEFLLEPPSLGSSPASEGMFPSLSGQSPVLGGSSVEDDSPCMSFAQMLRDGKARVDVGLRITQKKDMLLAPPVADSDGESDGSDRVPIPSFQNSFSQAFDEALQQLNHGPTPPPIPVVVPVDNGGKKKKKKQKLLFSTSMVHTK